MVQYLTKEEVRQWRSSLEKITLEEFAKRLGKEIQENKRTHDIVDMLVNNESISTTQEHKAETEVQKAEAPKPQQAKAPSATATMEPPSIKLDSKVNFSKSLTDREQKVFDYLVSKKGESVKAQELASVLDIPRDYIYKYIRNLRKKMTEELLVNSDEGGFILKI